MRTIIIFLSLITCAYLCSAADKQPPKHIITMCTLALMHQGLGLNAVKYSQNPTKLQTIMKDGLSSWCKNNTKDGSWRADNLDDMNAIEEIYRAGGGRISPSRRFKL